MATGSYTCKRYIYVCVCVHVNIFLYNQEILCYIWELFRKQKNTYDCGWVERMSLLLRKGLSGERKQKWKMCDEGSHILLRASKDIVSGLQTALA